MIVTFFKAGFSFKSQSYSVGKVLLNPNADEQSKAQTEEENVGRLHS